MSVAVSPAIGAVLAGGLGSRLGGDKASVPLAGRPLILHSLLAVEEAGLAPLIVAKADSKLPTLSLPTIAEPAEPRHPLCGIVAALEEAGRRGASAVVVVACDMPLLPPALIAWLAELEEPLALPLLDGHPQPLAARYAIDLLPALRLALDGRPGPSTPKGQPGPSTRIEQQRGSSTPTEGPDRTRQSDRSRRIGPLTGIVMRLGPRLIDEAELTRFGDPHRMLHNINTAEDLRRASGWLPA